MKKFAAIVLLALFAVGCASALKKESDKISFEYEAITRGSYKKVIVKQDTVITIKDRDLKDVVTAGLKNGEWNSLLKSLEGVNLEGLNEIKAPSVKHQVDAAPIANLKVIRGDKTYQSKSFDHGNPPQEIKDVVEKIMAASDFKKK
ncbi:hypothetical protein Q763_05010 [Flavobacterium beibuense F44-8]|uniref:Lipoprotein n=1 Tax=Flavobacterium beibuense F44-8 TaxID=1406840 RepID=A0A0A2M4V9_9FLAO|nr:hypothetical protein [Flavobacterium beibuense]KGO83375.1 hypothetical protein Q763_05010 [Flavobacterium beibuense F44-8]